MQRSRYRARRKNDDAKSQSRYARRLQLAPRGENQGVSDYARTRENDGRSHGDGGRACIDDGTSCGDHVSRRGDAGIARADDGIS